MAKEKLKQRYKFIHFGRVAVVNCEYEWKCLTNKSNEPLGVILFYKPWKQYVIQFNDGCVFNNQCLADISDFLGQLTKNKP